jgi:hypothetical protein
MHSAISRLGRALALLGFAPPAVTATTPAPVAVTVNARFGLAVVPGTGRSIALTGWLGWAG